MLLLTAIPLASGPSRAQTSSAALPQGVAHSLQPLVDNHTLVGAVTLVASKDKVLSLEAVGCADVAAQKPMRSDCLFWIASMTKPITATALMMLVDEGKVSLDDPVEKYLPEFRGQMFIAQRDKDHLLLKKPKHPISIRNVLTHTSGLLYKSPIQQPTLDLFPLRTRVRSYAMLPLEFEPGSKFLYSSAGINTAARIVEVVSGMPYEKFLDQRLLEPLGMKDTTFWPNAAQLQRLAKSYTPNADKTGWEETPIIQLQYPLDDHQRQPVPGSGLFSTAMDLSRFCRMILGGGQFEGKRYLSERALRQMTSTQTIAPLPPYGLGWEISRKPGSSFGHGGSYHTFMRIDPEHQLIMVLLTQHAFWRSEEQGRKIFPSFQQAAVKAYAGVPGPIGQ
jgi:CubicO group peptidase (beta-lactamase class C family)